MRISIIGHAGSGKTTVANQISEKLDIKHIQLDRFWFEGGGHEIGFNASDEEKADLREYIKRNIMDAISKESWVSDGFYSRFQKEISERADVVIFLDIPLWKRLMNHIRRALEPSKRHKELKPWDEVTFFFEIIRRTKKFKPKFDKFLSEYQSKIIALRSRKEIRSYINKLQKEAL